MVTESLNNLMSKVSNADHNIKRLKSLKAQHGIDKQQVDQPRLIFKVSGRNASEAFCIDEEVFFIAVDASIEKEEAAIKSYRTTLAAMESLAANQMGVK